MSGFNQFVNHARNARSPLVSEVRAPAVRRPEREKSFTRPTEPPEPELPLALSLSGPLGEMSGLQRMCLAFTKGTNRTHTPVCRPLPFSCSAGGRVRVRLLFVTTYYHTGPRMSTPNPDLFPVDICWRTVYSGHMEHKPEPIKPATAHGCVVGRCNCPRSYVRCALYTNWPWASHDPDCPKGHVYSRCPVAIDIRPGR